VLLWQPQLEWHVSCTVTFISWLPALMLQVDGECGDWKSAAASSVWRERHCLLRTTSERVSLTKLFVFIYILSASVLVAVVIDANFLLSNFLLLPSVLWCCWLGGRKGVWPVKNWVVRYWHGYLSGVRCNWFAYGPADATATPSSLAPVKSRMVYLSGAGLPRLSWKKGY